MVKVHKQMGGNRKSEMLRKFICRFETQKTFDFIHSSLEFYCRVCGNSVSTMASFEAHRKNGNCVSGKKKVLRYKETSVTK